MQVPTPKTFFYSNQDIFKLWYEDESEALEDRISFGMRCLKYVAHLCIQLVILYTFTEAEDKYFLDTCSRRLECYNSCNKAYFPSLACQNLTELTPPLDYNITLNGNVFTSFYKYPDPSWVKKYMKDSSSEAAVPATAATPTPTPAATTAEPTIAPVSPSKAAVAPTYTKKIGRCSSKDGQDCTSALKPDCSGSQEECQACCDKDATCAGIEWFPDTPGFKDTKCHAFPGTGGYGGTIKCGMDQLPFQVNDQYPEAHCYQKDQATPSPTADDNSPTRRLSPTEPVRILEQSQTVGSNFQSYLDIYDSDTLAYHQEQYNKCYDYQKLTLGFPMQHDGTQQRLHTCFLNCKDYKHDDFKDQFEEDTRPNCTYGASDGAEKDGKLRPAAEFEPYLICLDDEDECARTEHPEEVGWGDIQILAWKGLYAVILAGPVQFLFELLCIYIVKVKQNTDKVSDNCKVLSAQLLIAVVYVVLLFQSIHDFYDVLQYGRPGLVLTTFVYCLLVDNVKSIPALALIYAVVVRRFCHLAVTEGEEVDPPQEKPPKQENQIPKLKLFCLKSLESTPVETFSMIVITVYTFFILFWLTNAEFSADGEGVDDLLMAEIDTVFLNFFLIEIILKSFSSNLMYLKDHFNMFDAFIVVLSEVLNLMHIIIKGISVLRLIRVVVIILRKITGNQSKMRHLDKQNNPVSSVVKILEQVIELSELQSVKKEARAAIELIESNKLYDLNFEVSSDQKHMDMDAKQWLNLTTDQASDPTEWFERDLDDFLKEIHRENEEIDPNKQTEDEERLKQLIEVNPRAWNFAIKTDSDMHKWNFDVFRYHEQMGDASLLHFGIKLFQQYDLLEKFSISDSNFKNLLISIKRECYDTTQYHNVLRIIDTTRNFHYFVKHGELMTHISDLHVMAGFLSCLLHDVAHPGVDNSFLIGIKHQKAIRYNDSHVLENHHCAVAFKLLLDPKNDIFELLSEAQYWNVRQIIIKMILSTDVTNHFDLISTFKTRHSLKSFPEDGVDSDIQLILNMCLYASDHCNPCKPAVQYFKWMQMEMEEYFQQGDIEKKMGYTVTPFFDRTTCNPFQFQRGYIEVIVEPLMAVWMEFMPNSMKQDTNKLLGGNKSMILQKIEDTKAMGNITSGAKDNNGDISDDMDVED